MSGEDLDYTYDYGRKVKMHAYKILIIFPNGDHEILHYTGIDAADQAFAALETFPGKRGEGLSFLKLYKPLKQYHV